MDKFNKEEFTHKNELVNKAIITLKKEFVGIDKQINEIMSSVRSWYLFPELQSRPVIVNIWGLSGTGKTSLVKRITELLEVDEYTAYFNFASICEATSFANEARIREEVPQNRSNIVFIYDEFQYANTLDTVQKKEIAGKQGLKPFWELLDTGIINKSLDFYDTSRIYQIISFLEIICERCPMIIENGVWVNAEECINSIDPSYRKYVLKCFHVPDSVWKKLNQDTSINGLNCVQPLTEVMSGIEDECYNENEPCRISFKDDFFINEFYFDRILNITAAIDPKNYRDLTEMKLKDMFKRFDFNMFVDFIEGLKKKMLKGYEMNYSSSIIFVIGNLDEAYNMSFNSDPDMSPDQFRKITEKISVSDIKDALKERFRNEQIARLGNTHIIYPSFSQKNFEDIITLNLERYNHDVKEMTGYDIRFHESLKKAIYNEGVYPTHGTRPIFSTIHEMVKSQLPGIMTEISDKGLNDIVSTLLWSFKDENITVEAQDKDGNPVCVYKNKIDLRLEKFRKTDVNSDEQPICALHESGHFVMYTKLFGKLPVKIASRTVSANTGGFIMEDVDDQKTKVSRQDKVKEIAVLLGGYMAEKIFFGEDEMSNGASSDLERATMLASKMIRQWGLGSHAYVTSRNVNGDVADGFGLKIREDSQDSENKEIENLIDEATIMITETFSNPSWHRMLKDSALYLCKNSTMPTDKMKELYDAVPKVLKKTSRNEDYYKNKIKEIELPNGY